MFGPKKINSAQQAPKKNAVDVLLSKLNALPASIDLLVAGAAACFAMFSVYVNHAMFVGLISTIAALCFAFLAVNSVLREMKWLKLLSAHSSAEILRQMNRQDFEAYLAVLFRLSGYQIRSAVNELHRQDDADWIMTKKKEVVLVQFNHFDEDAIGMRPLESLHKAAMIFQASSAIAITTGVFQPDARQWGQRKGLKLMTTDDLLTMAEEHSCVPGSSDTPIDSPDVTTTGNAPDLPRQHVDSIVFVDFAGLTCDLSGMIESLLRYPGAKVVASTLPPDTPKETLLPGSGLAVEGPTATHQSGRFFAIQHYLENQPKGKRTPWVALDSEPRQFPSGCTELVTINPVFGFNASTKARVDEALGLSSRHAS